MAERSRRGGLQSQLPGDPKQVQRPTRIKQVSDVINQVAQDLAVAGLGKQLRLDVTGGNHQAQQIDVHRRTGAVGRGVNQAPPWALRLASSCLRPFLW